MMTVQLQHQYWSPHICNHTKQDSVNFPVAWYDGPVKLSSSASTNLISIKRVFKTPSSLQIACRPYCWCASRLHRPSIHSSDSSTITYHRDQCSSFQSSIFLHHDWTLASLGTACILSPGILFSLHLLLIVYICCVSGKTFWYQVDNYDKALARLLCHTAWLIMSVSWPLSSIILMYSSGFPTHRLRLLSFVKKEARLKLY